MMNNEKIELLIKYIDSKIEYEIESREVDESGYRNSPSNELRHEIEDLLEKLRLL